MQQRIHARRRMFLHGRLQMPVHVHRDRDLRVGPIVLARFSSPLPLRASNWRTYGGDHENDVRFFNVRRPVRVCGLAGAAAFVAQIDRA